MPIHVVVFEAEPHVARMVACRLMRADFEVHSVHDGESAWEVIDRIRPQLLVTDLQPPALELVDRIRHMPATADLPIIGLCSANGDPAEVERLQADWQFWAILPKPFSPRRLIRLALEATYASGVSSPAV